MNSHITRYDLMPIPPVEAHTRWFEAGVLRFGVEYRVVNDAIAAASEIADARGDSRPPPGSIDDCGVSIHVVGRHEGEALEYLRFDCFDEDPHYHYVSWQSQCNEMLHIDPIAEGEALGWTLDRLRSRLPQMLARAGADFLVGELDTELLVEVLPRVAEAAYHSRYQHADGAGPDPDRGGEGSG
ncbi:MAG: hypothetical protein VCB99_07010 [Myxococcota bacterium]